MIDPKDLPKLKAMLERHEGRKNKPYLDSEGYATIGVGHKLTKFDKITEIWTEEDIDKVFLEDYKTARRLLEINCPWVQDFDSCRHCALVDFVFNVGVGTLMKFKKSLKALESHDWITAKDELLNSKWAKQVKGRAKEIAYMIETGQWQQ